MKVFHIVEVNCFAVLLFINVQQITQKGAMAKISRNFLAETLREYIHNPAFALWRAIELRLLDTLQLAEPILDVGCGDGSFTRILFGTGYDITGIDPEEHVLQQARATAAFKQILRADATSLPLADESFASVFSNCVLEHIPNDVAAVHEMARVLQPGGTVAITVPSPGLRDGLHTVKELRRRGEDDRAAEYQQEFDRRQIHFHYRMAEQWREIFAEAGLQVVQVTPYLTNPVIDTWDRIEGYFGQPIIRTVLTQKHGGVLIRPLWLRRRIAHCILRKYYRSDVQPGEPHGCWMVVAKKPPRDE